MGEGIVRLMFDLFDQVANSRLVLILLEQASSALFSDSDDQHSSDDSWADSCIHVGWSFAKRVWWKDRMGREGKIGVLTRLWAIEDTE